MSTTLPFILHILVADGDPDGQRVVERSNWVAMAPTAGLAGLQPGPTRSATLERGEPSNKCSTP
jgi:hypothetical protein